jgi:hypothetical protein
MIDRHYAITINRYVDDLARKSALILHAGATRQLMREVASLSKAVAHLANHKESQAMSRTISNSDDIIDSRDVIERMVTGFVRDGRTRGEAMAELAECGREVLYA